ncbi:MAG: hypothetical protein V4773_22760, partial [Verrucomicrobiota bacterium]
MLLPLLVLPVAAATATWRTVSGETFAGTLSGVYGGLVILSDPKGTVRVMVDTLDDEGVARVADFIARRPPT